MSETVTVTSAPTMSAIRYQSPYRGPPGSSSAFIDDDSAASLLGRLLRQPGVDHLLDTTDPRTKKTYRVLMTSDSEEETREIFIPTLLQFVYPDNLGSRLAIFKKLVGDETAVTKYATANMLQHLQDSTDGAPTDRIKTAVTLFADAVGISRSEVDALNLEELYGLVMEATVNPNPSSVGSLARRMESLGAISRDSEARAAAYLAYSEAVKREEIAKIEAELAAAELDELREDNAIEALERKARNARAAANGASRNAVAAARDAEAVAAAAAVAERAAQEKADRAAAAAADAERIKRETEAAAARARREADHAAEANAAANKTFWNRVLIGVAIVAVIVVVVVVIATVPGAPAVASQVAQAAIRLRNSPVVQLTVEAARFTGIEQVIPYGQIAGQILRPGVMGGGKRSTSRSRKRKSRRTKRRA